MSREALDKAGADGGGDDKAFLIDKLQDDLDMAMSDLGEYRARCHDMSIRMSVMEELFTQQAVTPKDRIMPQRYDGSTDFDAYIELFNKLATLQNWDARRSAVILLSKLDGEAFEVASSVSDKSFGNLVIELSEHFGVRDREVIVHELKARVQQKGESFAALASAIRKLVQRAYPDIESDTQETLSVEYFVDAIADRKVRCKVRDHKPKTLKDAAREAREVVAHREVEDSLSKSSRGSAHAKQVEASTAVTEQLAEGTAQAGQLDVSTAMTEQLAKLNERISQLQSAFTQQQTAPAPAVEKDKATPGKGRGGKGRGRGREPPTCFACGYKGHIRRWCPFSAGAQFVPPVAQGAPPPSQPVLMPPPQWQGSTMSAVPPPSQPALMPPPQWQGSASTPRNNQGNP